MVWIFFTLVAVLVAGATAALATGRVSAAGLAEPVGSVPDHGLPESGLLAEDIGAVRFDTALRGYRMDQVDEVLDRLQVRLAELEELTARQGEGARPPVLAAAEQAGPRRGSSAYRPGS